MLVEINFGLVAKYLLYLDGACMLLCAQLIYIRDIDSGLYRPPDKSLSLLNAKIFFYCSSLLAMLLYLYFLLQRTWLITLFTLGTLAHLTCRLCFAYYFHFFFNVANIVGLFLGAYYRYVLWQEADTRSVLALPDIFCLQLDGLVEDNNLKRHRKSGRRSKHSRRSKTSEDDDDYDHYRV